MFNKINKYKLFLLVSNIQVWKRLCSPRLNTIINICACHYEHMIRLIYLNIYSVVLFFEFYEKCGNPDNIRFHSYAHFHWKEETTSLSVSLSEASSGFNEKSIPKLGPLSKFIQSITFFWLSSFIMFSVIKKYPLYCHQNVKKLILVQWVMINRNISHLRSYGQKMPKYKLCDRHGESYISLHFRF